MEFSLNSIFLKKDDVKKILAQYFGVDESCVINSQYSWTILKSESDPVKENGD